MISSLEAALIAALEPDHRILVQVLLFSSIYHSTPQIFTPWQFPQTPHIPYIESIK